MGIWHLLATVFAVAAILVMVATEMLRSVVHAKRRSKDGLGGTQDIAMWGTFLCLLLAVASITCWLVVLFAQGSFGDSGSAKVHQGSLRRADQESTLVHVFDTTFTQLLVPQREVLCDISTGDVERHEVPAGWIGQRPMLLRGVRFPIRLVGDKHVNERWNKSVRADVAAKLLDGKRPNRISRLGLGGDLQRPCLPPFRLLCVPKKQPAADVDPRMMSLHTAASELRTN